MGLEKVVFGNPVMCGLVDTTKLISGYHITGASRSAVLAARPTSTSACSKWLHSTTQKVAYSGTCLNF